jgi:predicted nucleotidyltransferase component of viral defense system
MNLSGQDYLKLYPLQDRVMEVILPVMPGFYLTGGTCLSRFYLNHRYSDDLDFFTNKNAGFGKITVSVRENLKTIFDLDEKNAIMTEDFVRFIVMGETVLKLDFVNDIAYKWGDNFFVNKIISVDNPANILANKLTALISRDEAKDVFDIIALAQNYSFNWKVIYKHAFEKQGMNEIDVSEKLASFPVKMLTEVLWLKEKVDVENFQRQIDSVVNDFILAKDNSLGVGKIPITDAVPLKFNQ